MNFSMGDVANAFKLKAADTMTSSMQKVSDTAADTAAATKAPAKKAPAVASKEARHRSLVDGTGRCPPVWRLVVQPGEIGAVCGGG